MNWPRWNELCFGCPMNCFASIEGKFTKLWFSQNCDKFFCFFFFHWFCNISKHISSNFLATLRLIIIMFGPLNKNDQKILLTLCTKFKTPVAPSKRFSKLLKFCMVYFITKINKMRDEEVKHLTFDFSWITLIFTAVKIAANTWEISYALPLIECTTLRVRNDDHYNQNSSKMLITTAR